MNKKSNTITAWNAIELSKNIHSKTVSCREVMETYLKHIDEVNPRLNAIVSMKDKNAILAESDEKDKDLAAGIDYGWMHGFPMAPKDLSNTKDIVTTQGCPVFKNNLPSDDSLMVSRMRKNGAIFIGKTNTPEFGFGSQTYNAVFGTTKNAYDDTKISGGSSGGAAVCLAAHMLPVADGSDMMGSLRNPGAYNNVFGFRPSLGRVPSYPSFDVFTRQLGYEGPMGRTVKDIAMLLSVQSGWDARTPMAIKEDPVQFTKGLDKNLKNIKIGWLGDWKGYLAMEDGILSLCENGLSVLEQLGCKVDEAMPDYTPSIIWDTWIVLRQFQSFTNLKTLFNDPDKKKLLKPESLWEIKQGSKLSAEEIGQAITERSNLYNAALKLFEKYDYLAVPTAQCFPYDAGIHWPAEVAGRKMDTYHRWMEIVIFASLTGMPVINVPVGFNHAGLPMGMQIIGRPQEDFAVLQIAYEYEKATQWVQKCPSPYAIK